MIPKPVVVIVVLALLAFLGADYLGQFLIPGYTANPIISGAIITAIGAILSGTKGPQPDKPTPPPAPPQAPDGTVPQAGRHRDAS